MKEFPREIFGLADTLEVLDLSANQLNSLPADLGRLHRLRVLFCSQNRFDRLPPSLGDCRMLSQVGFRSSLVREVPAESLPPGLRWLTLTDNRIERLPEALGARAALQKLMLSGNRLTRLPDTLANADRLELLRLSANRFDSLPPWLHRLPRLAWLAWAGNPLDRPPGPDHALDIDWSRLQPGAVAGEGASGVVHRAVWSPQGEPPRPVALKLFKNAMTSDGLPQHEIAASLAGGPHPNLLGALGRVVGHPDATEGLVMPLLDPGWRPLARPPSLESCSRDVWDPALRLDLAVAVRIARGVGAGAARLHARRLIHGDLYAHNVLWDGREGDAMLTDFGAASFAPPFLSVEAVSRLAATDVLAWGVLLGELIAHCSDPIPGPLQELQRRCVQPAQAARPSLSQALESLARAA